MWSKAPVPCAESVCGSTTTAPAVLAAAIATEQVRIASKFASVLRTAGPASIGRRSGLRTDSDLRPGRFRRLRTAAATLRSKLDRRALGWLLGVLLLVVGIATVGAAVYVWTSPTLSTDQKIVGLGDAFGGGTFLLALLAAAVALLAYQIAIQRPNLVPRIASDDVEGLTIGVGLGRADSTGERAIVRTPGFGRRGDSVRLLVTIDNNSNWSARNVAVRVDFKSIRRIQHGGDWVIAARDPITEDITGLQWEGGANYAIHGQWFRDLPVLFLNTALIEAPGDNCAIIVDVVAEGFRKSWTFPVKWLSRTEPPESARHGSIEGYTGYPSEGVPALRIYAIPADRSRSAKRTEVAAGPAGKYRWFHIENLAPGGYNVVAYREGLEVKGAYTVGARDGGLTPTEDHTLIPVVVRAGQVTSDVWITDWYSGNFPPEPAHR
jgi:hypothetical protein